MPFITYLSGLLTAQMLSDDHLISGVEIHCEEKGRCPSTCHLCRRPGKEQLSPTPVLLEINRVVPLYALIQDNDTREVSEPVTGQPHLGDPAQPLSDLLCSPISDPLCSGCRFPGVRGCFYVCLEGNAVVSVMAGPAAQHSQPAQTCISLPSIGSRQCHEQPRPQSFPVSMLVCRMCPVERSQEPSSSSVLHSWLQHLRHTCLRSGQRPPELRCGFAKVQREGRAIPLGQSHNHRRSLLLQEGPTRLEVTTPRAGLLQEL